MVVKLQLFIVLPVVWREISDQTRNKDSLKLMFLLYFLDTYINLVKYLQRVPLDVSINWRYLYLDAGKA